MDRAKYEKIFSREARQHLDGLEHLLLQVESSPNDTGLWNEIYGKLHSIKGMARALSFDRIVELSHRMESWCREFRGCTCSAGPRAVQDFFDGAGALRDMVAGAETKDFDSLVERFSRDPAQPPAADPTAAARRPVTVQPINEVRVRYALIEELLGLSQEIQHLEKSLPPLPEDQIATGLKNWIDHNQSLMKLLYFRLAQLRLMEVGDFAGLFVKTVRDLARQQGREVRVAVTGGDVQADVTLLERLREPVMHMLRNCIAHGIETPEERRRAGKAGEGTITIHAERRKENLLLVIGDDGRGIDAGAISEHLRSLPGCAGREIDDLSREELLPTIFSPDFSSADDTTDLAGRGIGMSVVAQVVESLGGRIGLTSSAGTGTRFTLRLPLSLSIVHAIVFGIGGYRFAVPTTFVRTIDRSDGADGSPLIYPLARLMGIGGGGERRSHLLQIVTPPERGRSENGRQEFALAADRIIGNKPLMVLPVGELLARAQVYSGIGVLDDGEIAMLLDVENLPPPV